MANQFILVSAFEIVTLAIMRHPNRLEAVIFVPPKAVQGPDRLALVPNVGAQFSGVAEGIEGFYAQFLVGIRKEGHDMAELYVAP